jgi:O-succinylbenzoate synthase
LRLNALSRFEIHSIEQPIQPGREEMIKICRESPIPIALDEELIGQEADKTNLLTAINPSFIILKPTLHGGMNHCRYWIEEATRLNIGWWITSALESNIGLNAICQFTANYDIQLPQGLGTGSLYVDNLEPYLTVDGGFISVPDKL